MPTLIPCRVDKIWELRSRVVNQLGRDQTGQIKYQFNSHGWRSSYEYNFIPEYAFFGSSSVLGIGVDQKQIFPSQFKFSHNYGLAVNYTNQDILDSILDFIKSPLYSPSTKLTVVWTDRDPEIIKESWNLLQDLNMFHFFCHQPISGNRSWSMIKNYDYDVSGTHMGPDTHRIFYNILCNLFKQ